MNRYDRVVVEMTKPITSAEKQDNIATSKCCNYNGCDHRYRCHNTGHGVHENRRAIFTAEAAKDGRGSAIKRGNSVGAVSANDPGTTTGSQAEPQKL